MQLGFLKVGEHKIFARARLAKTDRVCIDTFSYAITRAAQEEWPTIIGRLEGQIDASVAERLAAGGINLARGR
jgi:hypothetical protein